MNWTKVDKDWWRGGGGAWIRRVYFSGAERCGCEECGGKLFWLKGEYYCGWRDGDSVIGYFKTFKECAENLEKEKI